MLKTKVKPQVENKIFLVILASLEKTFQPCFLFETGPLVHFIFHSFYHNHPVTYRSHSHSQPAVNNFLHPLNAFLP